MMHSDVRSGGQTERAATRRLVTRLVTVVTIAVLLAGCAAGRTFQRGEGAARTGNWDMAVEHYRRAVQQAPNRTDYKIALERAMVNASLQHLDQARVFEARGQLDDALREYRRASEFDPPNRQIAAKVTEMERRVRDAIEAARPRPSIEQLREAARQAGPPPLLNLTTQLPTIRFTQSNLRDILNFIGIGAGINVTYDPTFADRPYTVQMEGVTLQEALNQILSANQLFYKVVNQRTILIVPDNPTKRAQYEELVIRTFYLSHADAAEMSQLINIIMRVGGPQQIPGVFPSKTNNTVTVRGSMASVAIIERVIHANDRPRAEVVVDVQILEVNRTRAKQFGLDLGSYAIGAVFSPEADPRNTGTTTGTPPAGDSGGLTPRPFNANTITRGISTADFYLAVPAAVVRFLESDSETRLVAKPQLRGAEGQKLTLNLGEEIPVPSTTFTPVAQGGANVNPLTSFNYRPVGVNVEITPRVTFEGDIILDLAVENSTRAQDVNIAGQNLPSFASRKVTTRLRLRDGESNLLAGLLRENDRRLLTGVPGLLRLPVIKQLFSSNNNTIEQTDIVMLLTPRIIRSHELTQQDVSPIYIGTQQTLGLGGPPPLITAPGVDAAEPPAATPSQAPAGPAPLQPGAQPGVPAPPTGAPAGVPQPGGGAGTAGGGQVVIPPGSSQNPGTTTLPAPFPAALPQPEGPAAAPAAATAPAGASTAMPSTSGPAPAAALPGAGGGQVIVSPPGTEFRVGGGPYTLPISMSGASRVSTLSLTITYNPSALRVRTLQEGSFMRSGGVQAAFTQQVDAIAGRIDIAIARSGDPVGVAGTGLLAAIVFDAIGAGPANLSVTGTGAAPGGGPLSLQFVPVPALTVR